jgi:hypothetical protein
MKRILNILYFVLLLSAVAFTQQKTKPVTTIASGTVSSAFSVPDGYTLTGINIPTMNTGTTTLYLLVSIDGTTYDTLYYGGSRYEETIVASGCNLTFKYPAVFNWSKFKVAVNTSQSSSRTLTPNYTKKY